MLNHLETVTMLNGCQISGIKGDYITKKIKKHGVYERDLYDFLVKFLKLNKNSICLDIGANIGNHTLTMALHAKKTYAFEPVPDLFEILENNIVSNRLSEKVCLFDFGLSDENGSLDIAIERSGNIGASSIVDKDKQGSLLKKHEVKNISIKKGDDVVKDHSINKIDLIKIDIEGHETQAILGLQKTITESRPVVCIEWNSDKVRDGFKEHKIFERIFPNYQKEVLIYDTPLKNIFRKNYLKNNILQKMKEKVFVSKTDETEKSAKTRAKFDESLDYICVLLYPQEKYSQYLEEIKTSETPA